MLCRKRKSPPPLPPAAPSSSLRSVEANLSRSELLTSAQQTSQQTNKQQQPQQQEENSASTTNTAAKEVRLGYEYHAYIVYATRDQPSVLQFQLILKDDEGDQQVRKLREHGFLVARLLQDTTKEDGDDLKYVLHGGDWREAYDVRNTGYFHQLKRPPPPAAVQVGINRMWTFTAAQLEHQRLCVACYYTSMDHTEMRPNFDVEIPVTKANKIVKDYNKPTRVFMEEMAKYMQRLNQPSTELVCEEMISTPVLDSSSSVASADSNNSVPPSATSDASESSPVPEPRLIVKSVRKKKSKAKNLAIQPITAQIASPKLTSALSTPIVATIVNEFPAISPTPMKVVEMNGTRFHSCRRAAPTLSPSPSPAPTVRTLSSASFSDSANSSPVSSTTTLRLSPYASSAALPLPQIMEIDFDSQFDDTHSNTSTLEQDEHVLQQPEWWVASKPQQLQPIAQDSEETTAAFSMEPAMKRSRFEESTSASLFHHIFPTIEDHVIFTEF